ncbi:hypothetical protein CL653_00510 [bacterium]|mgnify:CR=1 FL=1|nr:hypothetical protein [bacterium]
MTNVSKDKLRGDYREQLTKQFAKFFDEASIAMVNDFFTEAEQTVFIKRLAVILMLESGYTNYRIAKTLKLSHSTVASVRSKLDLGHYQTILKKTKSKKFNSKQFWVVVDVLIRAGLPPISGRDRWQHVPGMSNR